MSAFEHAAKFSHACEALEDWDGCKEFVADGATFTGQCEALEAVDTVEAYCEWMKRLGLAPHKGLQLRNQRIVLRLCRDYERRR